MAFLCKFEIEVDELKNLKSMRPYILSGFILLLCFSCLKKQPEAEYPVTPVPFTNVIMSDNFWAARIKTNHEVTIPIAIQKSIETGRVDNFAIAGGSMEGEFCTIFPFDDSDVYKIIYFR